MNLDVIQNALCPDEDWPALIPLDTHNLPRLNLANLPGWLGDFVGAVAEFTETPIELAAGLALASCATATARCLKVQVKEGYYEDCNLWIVTSLPSGNRKSAVQSLVTKPLVEWERQQYELLQPKIQRITSELKTMEARIKSCRNKAANTLDKILAQSLMYEVAELEATLPVIPTAPQLWTSDATPEVLGVLLVEHNEKMAWLSSEGGIFDILSGRYSNIPNLDLFLKSHSGDPERVHRIGRPSVLLQNPLLTIGLSPQPDVLRGLNATPSFRGRGLIARFLYLLPQSPLGYRQLISQNIPAKILTEYHKGLTAMLNWSNAELCGFHVLHVKPDALSEHHAFALAIESMMRPSGDMEYCTDWAGKAPGAAIRLAGVLHAVEHAYGCPWNDPIGLSTMKNALDLMAVFSKHSLAALDVMGTDINIVNARKVWNWLQHNRQPNITANDIFNGLRSTFNKAVDLLEPLSILEERGYIKIQEQHKEGRGRKASPLIRIRPELMGGWK